MLSIPPCAQVLIAHKAVIFLAFNTALYINSLSAENACGLHLQARWAACFAAREGVIQVEVIARHLTLLCQPNTPWTRDLKTFCSEIVFASANG